MLVFIRLTSIIQVSADWLLVFSLKNVEFELVLVDIGPIWLMLCVYAGH